MLHSAFLSGASLPRRPCCLIISFPLSLSLKLLSCHPHPWTLLCFFVRSVNVCRRSCCCYRRSPYIAYDRRSVALSAPLFLCSADPLPILGLKAALVRLLNPENGESHMFQIEVYMWALSPRDRSHQPQFAFPPSFVKENEQVCWNSYALLGPPSLSVFFSVDFFTSVSLSLVCSSSRRSSKHTRALEC